VCACTRILPAARAPLESESKMTPEDLDRLRPIGCNDAIACALGLLEPQSEAMRITAVQRDRVTVDDGRRSSPAEVTPRLARELAARGDSLVVGDWILADNTSGSPRVTARMPPLTQIVRRASDGSRQALVSNVNIALLIMGLDDDHNLRRLERYLAMVQSAAVRPAIVLTKQDLVDASGQRLAELHRRIPADVPLHALDARSPTAASALQEYLVAGQTLAMLGSSGAGKSTLTNTLLGQEVQLTGAVRAGDSRGRHTTTVRTLHRLPQGACIIDTPGLRGLELDASEADLAAGFVDIAELALQCRFRDCRHGDEPGCAVRAGIDADRLANYQKLRRELRRDSMTFLDRRREVAQWIARGRAAEHRMKMKRG